MREALRFEKKFCSIEDVVICKKVFGKTSVAEKVSGEMGGEEVIAFEDQVGLGEEDEKDFL